MLIDLVDMCRLIVLGTGNHGSGGGEGREGGRVSHPAYIAIFARPSLVPTLYVRPQRFSSDLLQFAGFEPRHPSLQSSIWLSDNGIVVGAVVGLARQKPQGSCHA